MKELTNFNDERKKNNQKNGNNILQIKEITEAIDDNSSDILINCIKKNSTNKSFQTLLQVKQAKKFNPKNPLLNELSYVFLDSGSEICLIKITLAEKLGLEPVAINKFKAIGIFGQSITKQMPIFDFHIICKNDEIIKVRARGVEENFMGNLKRIALEKMNQIL